MNDKPKPSDVQLGTDFLSSVARSNDQISAVAGALDYGASTAAKAALAFEEDARRKVIDASYGFLGKHELEKLQAQMAGIEDIARSIPKLDPGYAVKQAAEELERSFHDKLYSLGISDEALRAATHTYKPNGDEVRGVSDAPWMDPPFKNTPLGRAVLENAAHSKEVANKVESLVGLVAGLNQTLVKDVLPAWFKKVEADQKSAKESFDHAARELRWAIVAIFVSVIVTVLTTWWQIGVTKELDRENGEQQKRTESVLRDQLAHQQKLAEQQTRDAAAMLEAISALKTINRLTKPKRPPK